MECMYITSDIPLVPGGDSDAFDRCKIQFSILSHETVKSQGGEKSIFAKDYESRQPMPFKKFLAEFGDQFRAAHPTGCTNGSSPVDSRPRIEDADVDAWLGYKLVFHEEEAHNFLQTSDG
jgi:adenosine deaminase CECR1